MGLSYQYFMSRKDNLSSWNMWLSMIYEHVFKTQCWLDSRGFSINTVPWLCVGAIKNAPSWVLTPSPVLICLLLTSPFLSLFLQLLQLPIAQIIWGNLSMFLWSFFFLLLLLHVTPSENPRRTVRALPMLEAKHGLLLSIGDLLCGEGKSKMWSPTWFVSMSCLQLAKCYSALAITFLWDVLYSLLV